MKKSLLLSVGLLIIISVLDVRSQELIKNSTVTGVCYAGKKVNRVYFPPPKGFEGRMGAKGGGTITVSYTGFTASAKAAAAFAESLLETILPKGVNVYVKMSWTRISDAGVLANTSITSFASGVSIDAREPRAFYPVTLAEKIAGKGLNGDNEADVELVVNSTIKWYLGTDGNTPTTSYDLVTVILHELCHGLGFFDSMDVQNSLGSYGFGGIPVIYDTYVENLTEEKLTDTLKFSQNTTALYQQLTGGQLYFNGPVTSRYLSGGRARLYAPSTFDPGSSVSHLDELRTLPENSLMTPFIDLGEANHNPARLTSAILGDVGWINTKITPGKLKDTEAHITQIEVTASIKSDTSYNRNKVGLVYSFNRFATSDTLIMISPASDNNFNRIVTVPGYQVRMDYFIYAEDNFLRLYRSPSLAWEAPATVFIGTDTVKPVITHTPSEYFFEKIDSILFDANVTDNLGIDTVYVEYKVNDGPSKFFGLSLLDQDNYKRSFNVRPESLKGGDAFNYRIIAVDQAAGKNTRISPSTGFHSIKIEALESVVTNYATDFSNAAADFFSSGFQITQPPDFSSPGLNSDHPYKSPEVDNKEFNFSSVLRHPVVFHPSGMVISYRELVLVEPGAEGSVFGFSDFYDYVIVEGSKDYGKSWFGLADGYDCRFISTWDTAYNSLTDGQNSTFVGKESMMVTHTLYPRLPDIITSGDSVLIRFRLFSDPYANGWGWAIDDLKINPLADYAEELNVKDLTIYPNPGNGIATIYSSDNNNFKPVKLSVYNSTGQCILNKPVSPDNEIKLDLSGNPSGIYFIVIQTNSGVRTLRYSLLK